MACFLGLFWVGSMSTVIASLMWPRQMACFLGLFWVGSMSTVIASHSCDLKCTVSTWREAAVASARRDPSVALIAALKVASSLIATLANSVWVANFAWVASFVAALAQASAQAFAATPASRAGFLAS